MFCFLEVAMFIFGIVTLAKGKFTLSKKRVVTGPPAYAIGAVLTATPLLVMFVAFSIGVFLGLQNPEAAKRGEVGNSPAFVLIDVVGVILGIAIAIVLGMLYGRDPNAPVMATYSSPYSMPPNAPLPINPSNPYSPPQANPTNRPNPPYTY
jgi:hypothetical protein